MDEGFQSSAFAQSTSDKPRPNRSVDVEFGADIESGIALSADISEFDGLKTFLDSNRDAMKLDAMKRIIKMVARGRDCSELFPAVVKNVVSKDAEIRKLVYIYLTRYAEEQQDTALLSVSTFQRSLKDSNQLIRASALRVLCSTRIPMLVPIMMLAIQDASKDLSPYVRKTAAHAILKVYSLEPNEKEQFVEIIERLLADKTTLVIGSAVRAFEEVCPERFDLIHPHYRKLCTLLMDVDEWGQVIMIGMLTRYARTQFLDPERKPVIEEKNHSVTEGDLLSLSPVAENGHDKDLVQTGAGDQSISSKTIKTEEYSMADALPLLQSDYDALVESCRFLLQSRNTAVVMAASQLLFALKSKEDYPVVAKALVRSLRGPKEVQYALLSNIATLSIDHPGLFEPYLRSFYCFSNDPLYVKLVKLDILGNLATETSSPTILREFQYYVTQPDHKFVTATIQAIGRCASTIPQITDICLNGLVRLMSRPDEKVVAECVVVLRKLLQMQSCDHKEIIIQIAQLTDTMTVPSALASILWLLGEYSHRVPKIAPDVLRKMAKTFINQEPVVKLQVLNLAAKLAIVNPKQTHLLAQYVFTLARYDQNYDIRDRSRLLRALIFPRSLTESCPGDGLTTDATESKPPVLGYLAKHARKICLAVKPAPVLESQSKERSTFVLGSLSHLLNRCVNGYQDLPDWPAVPPNPWSRVVQTTAPHVALSHSPASSTTDRVADSRDAHPKSLKDFFSDSDEGEDGEFEDLDQHENIDEDEEVDDDYASEEDTNPVGLDKEPSGKQPLTETRAWEDHIDEEVQSDLVELEAESVSSSDSEFALGPLQQLIQKKKSNNLSATLEPVSIDAASVSPVTTLTTEPSESEERTFSSALQDAARLPGSTHVLLGVAESSDTETETDDTEGDEDEDLRNPVLPNITHDPPENKCTVPNTLHLDGINDHLLNTVTGQPDMAPKSTKTCLLAVEDIEGTSGEVSGTSSATLPAFSPSLNSTNDLQKSSLLSESPSIAIEPSLIPHVINTTPTPLPTLDPCFQLAGTTDLFDTESSPSSCIPSVPFPISVNWSNSIEALRWFKPVKSIGSQIELRYQFSRLKHELNPNLVMLRLEFNAVDQDAHSGPTDIRLDLRSTVMGRLLLDANRIEPFVPIDRLPTQAKHRCMMGIDFAGFTDPIEVNLVYNMGTGTADETIAVPLSISPPPGELIRPNNRLGEVEYWKLKDELTNSHDVAQSSLRFIHDSFSKAYDPCALVKLILRTANLHFHGASVCSDVSETETVERHTAPPINSPMEPSLLFGFSALTISDAQPCLVEMRLKSGQCSPSQRASAQSLMSDPAATTAYEKNVIVTVFCPVRRIRTALCVELDAELREAFDAST